jgi:hypothetical protein
MLFSATLDAGVDVLAKRYLTRPVTHHADSEQSPVSTMSHHVLHIAGADRLPVLTDLASAPGRTMMFTRTKHGAKKLAKQLNGAGVPAVELHGNLSQNARVRNLDAFMSGKASTMVATDIAARGIHVDDVALVVHADPPVEHKAYLHRSGRTARAGAEGTVITIMTDEQVRDVRALTKAAGIRPQTTRAHVGHPVLTDLAPGERTLSGGLVLAGDGAAQGGGRGNGGGGRGGNGGGRGRSAGGAGRGGSSAAGRSGQGGGSGRGQQSQGSGTGGNGGGQGGPRRSAGGGRPSTGGAGGRGRTGGAGGRSGASRGSGSVVAFSSSSQSGRR